MSRILEARLENLYLKLRDVFGYNFTRSRFDDWVAQYNRESREFHGILHLLEITEIDSKLLRSLKDSELPLHKNNIIAYAITGAFFHDVEYPTTGEGLTKLSKDYIEKYVQITARGSKTRPIERSDVLGNAILDLFDLKPGEFIPKQSVNEVYCAYTALGELRKFGHSEEFILGVIAVIEATRAFKDPDRLNHLRTKVVAIALDHGFNIGPIDFKEIMVAAACVANKDVLGFLGGLDPNRPRERATVKACLSIIANGDRLRPEDVKTLKRASFVDGRTSCTLEDFKKARTAAYQLYRFVIPNQSGEIPNLFHSVEIDHDFFFPPKEWVDNANRLAAVANEPVRLAEAARYSATMLIWALATKAATPELNPETVKLMDLTRHINSRIPDKKPEADWSVNKRIAHKCCEGVKLSEDLVIRRSPIAQEIIIKLSDEKIPRLAEKINDVDRTAKYSSAEKADYVLKLLTQDLGKRFVSDIRNELVTSIEGMLGSLAASGMRNLEIGSAMTR